jgi:hypothetical protein
MSPSCLPKRCAALSGPELMGAIKEFHRATEKYDIPASIDARLRFHRLFYDLSGHGALQSPWNGREIKLRLHLTVDPSRVQRCA